MHSLYLQQSKNNTLHLIDDAPKAIELHIKPTVRLVDGLAKNATTTAGLRVQFVRSKHR